MENDVIFSQFDDIDEKVEFLIELCKSLESTNQELQGRIEGLEQDLQSKIEIEQRDAEQKTMIKTKVDGLLSKLNSFSELN